MKLKAHIIRYASLFAAVILSLPLPLGILTGFYLWLSPYLFINSALASWRFAAFHGFGAAVLLLAILYHRWFCRFVCPMGALCDIASKWGSRKFTLRRVPSIHKHFFVTAFCMAVLGIPLLNLLDPINFFTMFFDGFQSSPSEIVLLKLSGLILILLFSFIVPHCWCQRLCPLGGMQVLLTEIKKAIQDRPVSQKLTFNSGRRYFVASVIGLGIGAISRSLAAARLKNPLRPPGAAPESRFVMLCARCGNCVNVCPTDIIYTSLDMKDPIGALAPSIRFEQSYCLPDCVRCGSVCPSGAITPFSLEEKKQLVIGIARIDLKDCLLTNNRECDRCKAFCEYGAIQIVTSEDDFSSYPEIVVDRCVGCGACQIVCPVGVISVVGITT